MFLLTNLQTLGIIENTPQGVKIGKFEQIAVSTTTVTRKDLSKDRKTERF